MSHQGKPPAALRPGHRVGEEALSVAFLMLQVVATVVAVIFIAIA